MTSPDSPAQEAATATEELRRRSRRPRPRALSAAELGAWLTAKRPGIVERWLGEIRSRSGGPDPEVDELLEGFLDLLASFLPLGIGPWRDQVEPLFREAAELYGSLGGLRGLAAGEAVEEVQLLRESVLRFLFRDPPARTGGGGVGFREMLRLNRLVDLAVTHASVGHTDALFFSLLHDNALQDRPRDVALEEMRAQLLHLAEERDRLFPVAMATEDVPGA